MPCLSSSISDDHKNIYLIKVFVFFSTYNINKKYLIINNVAKRIKIRKADKNLSVFFFIVTNKTRTVSQKMLAKEFALSF